MIMICLSLKYALHIQLTTLANNNLLKVQIILIDQYNFIVSDID